jgi:hypothetical protein
MTNSTPPPDPAGAKRGSADPTATGTYNPLAGFLSYLVPGLGQMTQGRIAKGLLFFVCLYGLFFTGMAMGDWKNVYIPETAKDASGDPPWDENSWHLPRGMANLYNRLHFVGQFWIGVAAWPAVLQYNHVHLPFLKDFQKPPSKGEDNRIAREGKLPDLGWVYTVVAGVLNLLVIYDAVAGPAFVAAAAARKPPVPHEPSGQEAAVA